MKICFLTHNLRQDNGAGVLSRRLILGLRRELGADIVVLTTVGAGEPYEHPLLYPDKLRLLGRLREMRNIIRSCDLVYAMDAFPYGFIAVLASLGMRKKIIVTAVGSGSILPLYQRRFAWMVRWVYRRVSAITSISAFTKEEVLKKIPDLSITVINPGVDIEEFSPARKAVYAVDRFKPYILGVGQLRWRKGYHFSIRAFAKVRERFPDLNYVIVGKRYRDDYYDRLQKLIDELGLRDRIFILENIDNRSALVDVYKGAELFCLFSQNINHDVEGFGLVFLEAAAAGLPVVGSKNCGIDDAVLDGKNGILVPTRSPGDFADALISILGDPQKKKTMAEASLVFARAMNWEGRIAEYADVSRSLMLSGRTPRV